jgi:hypothetical protein
MSETANEATLRWWKSELEQLENRKKKTDEKAAHFDNARRLRAQSGALSPEGEKRWELWVKPQMAGREIVLKEIENAKLQIAKYAGNPPG